jgi:ribonuclease T2
MLRGWLAAVAGKRATAAASWGSLAAAAALWLSAASAAPTPANLIAPADFDFYVLTLSWSPGFCDLGGARKSPEQCGMGARAGFVTHGLWPDNANRADPRACGLGPDYIPGAVLAVGARVYPSRGLAIHEWREHGTCTGLDAAHYFRAVQYARDEFTIPKEFSDPTAPFAIAPDAIVKAFAAVNDNLEPDSIAVTCERGELVDVRFCLTRDLRAFARCPKVARRSCRDDSIRVSPIP